MLRLVSEITITSADGKKVWQFESVASCVIAEDTATLTDTCTIELPKKTIWQGAPVGSGDNPPIKRGDKIVVKLGYDDQLVQRFSGFIRDVDNKTPVKITCEDGMFILKQTAIKKQGFKSITLDELIEKLLAGTGIKYHLIDKGINLGAYRITQPTVAAELNEMKKEFPLLAYFRNYSGTPVLYVGLTHPLDNVKKESFVFGKNIIEERFEYKRKEDIKVRVKAVSVGKHNKKIEVEIGDKEGEEIQLKINGIDKEALTVFAQQALTNAKYEGLRGSFTTFGEPHVTKTDRAYIETEDGKKGTYLIKKCEVSFGTSGYRQTVELGQIISK